MVIFEPDQVEDFLRQSEDFIKNMAPKRLKLVQAWIEIHKDELFANWELAAAGEEPFRIAPLQ
jgi:hypothetical protein